MDYLKIRELRTDLRSATLAPDAAGVHPAVLFSLKKVIDVVDEILLELEAPEHYHRPDEVVL